MLLEQGLNLSLRPMHYPEYYEMYKSAIANTWTVDEVDFSDDLNDIRMRLSGPETHMIKRLVAFFATGDTIVANNLVLNLYKHINVPEARLYLSRQLYEEALHIQFYLTLLDTYIPDVDERQAAFEAINTIPSIKQKADFCFKWIDSIHEIDETDTDDKKRQFLMNLICFAACIEGLFFYAAFAYVFYMRNKGLLNSLAMGTNWVFRDEVMHMTFGLATVNKILKEYPHLKTDKFEDDVRQMLKEAIDCETQFALDLLEGGIPGFTTYDMRKYLEHVADLRLKDIGMETMYNTHNPFDFMLLQDVQELTNFFERRVSAYQIGIPGTVRFNEEF